MLSPGNDSWLKHNGPNYTKHDSLENSISITFSGVNSRFYTEAKTSLTADQLIVHFRYRVKLVYHRIETSLSTDEFKKMHTSLKNSRQV